MSDRPSRRDSSPDSRRELVCGVIRRLALIADDDQLSVETPGRVGEALACHGYLLNDRENAMLQNWMTRSTALRPADCLP
ncbi:MAG TPA: hypothetical protein VE134_00835 [Methanomicrobiales archaeon]|nr:hypothetical protein [Methanomicrobiales archaeon]